MLRIWFLICVLAIVGPPCHASGAATKPLHISGTWNISWQARIGMERGSVQFQQKGSHFTGQFQGTGAPGLVSGDLKDSAVTFSIEFEGKTRYTMVFTGTVDGDKMTGNFQFQGMKDGYDQHGENVQSINYTWIATHLPDQQKPSQQQKPAT